MENRLHASLHILFACSRIARLLDSRPQFAPASLYVGVSLWGVETKTRTAVQAVETEEVQASRARWYVRAVWWKTACTQVCSKLQGCLQLHQKTLIVDSRLSLNSDLAQVALILLLPLDLFTNCQTNCLCAIVMWILWQKKKHAGPAYSQVRILGLWNDGKSQMFKWPSSHGSFVYYCDKRQIIAMHWMIIIFPQLSCPGWPCQGQQQQQHRFEIKQQQQQQGQELHNQ